MAEMNLTASAKRTQDMEEYLGRIRADTVRGIAKAKENYDKEVQPVFDSFQMLEIFNRPDHEGKAEFVKKVDAMKKALERSGEKIMAGMDAMEKNIRECHEATEAAIARGSPGPYVLQSVCLRDFMD